MHFFLWSFFIFFFYKVKKVFLLDYLMIMKLEEDYSNCQMDLKVQSRKLPHSAPWGAGSSLPYNQMSVSSCCLIGIFKSKYSRCVSMEIRNVCPQWWHDMRLRLSLPPLSINLFPPFTFINNTNMHPPMFAVICSKPSAPQCLCAALSNSHAQAYASVYALFPYF